MAAHAAQINGSIGFTGVYTQNGGTSGNLSTATSMGIDTVDVDTADGDLTGATAPLSFANPIGVNANAGALAGNQLWSVTVGADVFTFDVTTSAQPFTSNTSLVLNGLGTMDDGAGGFDATAGVWQLTFGVSGTSFTWQATSATVPAATPDGGSTVALMGAVLAGLGLMRRKLFA
jgi:hypothetical protein